MCAPPEKVKTKDAQKSKAKAIVQAINEAKHIE